MIIERIRRVKEVRKEGATWKEILLLTLDYLGIKVPNKSVIRNFKEVSLINSKIVINRVLCFFSRPEKKVLIVETGVLGDTMLVVNAFKEISNYLSCNNKKLYIVCSNTMREIYEKYGNITNAEYLCFENRNTISYEEYREVVDKLGKHYFEYMMLRDGNPLGFRIAGTVKAKCRLYYSYDVSTRNRIEKKLIHKIFNEVKEYPKETFIPNIWKDLNLRIGNTSYFTQIAKLDTSQIDEKEYSKCPKENYVMICPEASTRSRCIDGDKVEEIVDYIAQNYKHKIVISINGTNEGYYEELLELRERYQCEIYCGNTTFKEFVALCSRATLLIGCDSGSAHLSAGLGVQTICLTGYWDSIHFFPYVFDHVEKGDTIPQCIYPEKKPICAYCGERGDLHSEPECYKRVESGHSVKCVADIKIEDVIKAINKVLG